MGEAHITANKNSVPNDPKSPFVTSGLRLGTPAGTTRGFGVDEFTAMTHWMCDILDDMSNDAVVEQVRAQVTTLCQQYPVYG